MRKAGLFRRQLNLVHSWRNTSGARQPGQRQKQ
jgi:hypothetical protein